MRILQNRAAISRCSTRISSPRKDRVFRAEMKSPVHGIVNKINVTTIGAVVQPGGNLMDIVPLDDSLLVEGQIRPQDIAFIRAGQDAVVKISAYDSSVYGSLKGKVERISADTITEDKPGRTARRRPSIASLCEPKRTISVPTKRRCRSFRAWLRPLRS